MTMAEFALARYAKQLRTELDTRELTEREAELLTAVERDILRWQNIRDDQTQQVPRAPRPRN
jgi:hypothetical protein